LFTRTGTKLNLNFSRSDKLNLRKVNNVEGKDGIRIKSDIALSALDNLHEDVNVNREFTLLQIEAT
jgi:hypothetical protein